MSMDMEHINKIEMFDLILPQQRQILYYFSSIHEKIYQNAWVLHHKEILKKFQRINVVFEPHS